MEEKIKVYSYSGEGLNISYKNPDWMVGVKNYKPASDVRYMTTLERHLLTDELFVPLTEGCMLVSMDQCAGAGLESMRMELGSICVVPQGRWHNVVMPEDGKIILIERPGTCSDNSEFYPLSDAQREMLARLYAAL